MSLFFTCFFFSSSFFFFPSVDRDRRDPYLSRYPYRQIVSIQTQINQLSTRMIEEVKAKDDRERSEKQLPNRRGHHDNMNLESGVDGDGMINNIMDDKPRGVRLEQHTSEVMVKDGGVERRMEKGGEKKD